MDECSSDADQCDQSAECTNTIGSYTCKCKTGFTGDGWTCAGIKLTGCISSTILFCSCSNCSNCCFLLLLLRYINIKQLHEAEDKNRTFAIRKGNYRCKGNFYLDSPYSVFYC